MNPNVKLHCTFNFNNKGISDGSQVPYFFSKFPGGEIHVKVPDYSGNFVMLTIEASICCSDDLMTVLLLNNALKNNNRNSSIDLILRYIPYAQQDRICESGEALSVKVMADLINSCGFNSVTVYDPHSYVSTALINNCKIVEVADILKKDFELYRLFKETSNLDHFVDVLVAPDTGAHKKVLNVSRFGDIPVVHATKERINGEVQSVKLHGDVAGKNCLVIDDICVGGRTFTELGKALKDAGAGDLSLYVTHGIFSKGLDELNLYYKKIYSTDSRPEAVKLAEEKKIELIKL